MIVRLQHSESGGYVCSDDTDFTGDNLAEVFLYNYKGKSTDIEAISSQTYFELEIVGGNFSTLGQSCLYSGNISNESSHVGGMNFRLRHLNTGRLVVMQELAHESQTYKTVGLSEHLPMEITTNPASKSVSKQLVSLVCPDEEQLEIMELNSIFRLVSTGVDIDNRIRAETSVQI